MDEIQRRVVHILRRTEEELRAQRVPETLVSEIERLVTQVNQPCEIAVVGMVKAGKSSFVNALLGVDRAKVGILETTATINHFYYGQEETIYCVWRGGQREEVSQEFVDSLQGRDLETLRRADGIDHLEFYLPLPALRELVLVDTPGIGSVIDEHQNRTADYMELEGQLRTRHSEETSRIGGHADGIIYCISGVARSSDKDFLEEFRKISQGQEPAFNALAILGKIDLYADTVLRRKELADKTADQLKDFLNTVLPASAGLQLAIKRLLEDDRAGLRRIVEGMQSIPPEKVKKFLDGLLEFDPGAYPRALSVEERKDFTDSMPTVFKMIAEMAAREADIQRIEQELLDIAGFRQIREVLEQQIFSRRKILRCNRILNEARRILSREIKQKYLGVLQRKEGENKAREERYLSFLRQSADLDPMVARELEELVREQTNSRVRQIEKLVRELEREMEVVAQELKRHNENFEALRWLLDPGIRDDFTEKEQNELRPLFGLRGIELEKRLPIGQISSEYVRAQYEYWNEVELRDRRAIRRKVAMQAKSCYSYILSNLR